MRILQAKGDRQEYLALGEAADEVLVKAGAANRDSTPFQCGNTPNLDHATTFSSNKRGKPCKKPVE